MFRLPWRHSPAATAGEAPTCPGVSRFAYGGQAPRAVLEAAVRLANEAFHEDFRVSQETVDRWLQVDPQTILIALDDDNHPTGYASLFNVSRETFRGLINGEICDWDICEMGPEPRATSDDDAYLYIGAVVVREDLRGGPAFKTLQQHIMRIVKRVAAGVVTVHVGCEIMTPSAERAAIKMGLRRERTSVDGFPIFTGSF
jgi:hypothetical protein